MKSKTLKEKLINFVKEVANSPATGKSHFNLVNEAYELLKFINSDKCTDKDC